MTETVKHIEWIDGAKGVAILSVILVHCLPDLDKIYAHLHLDQAVPVFVFITSFLIAKHYKSWQEYFSGEHFAKMCRAIFPPFLIALICEVIVYYIHSGLFFNFKHLMLAGGCFGPGSYYLFLYLSLWVLCPLVTELVRRTPLWISFIIMLAISMASEYAVTLMIDKVSHLEALYRLAPIRYLMILWLGAAYPRFGKKENIIFVIAAIISGLILLYTVYIADNQSFMITTPLVERKSLVYCVVLLFTCFAFAKGALSRNVVMARET